MGWVDGLIGALEMDREAGRGRELRPAAACSNRLCSGLALNLRAAGHGRLAHFGRSSSEKSCLPVHSSCGLTSAGGGSSTSCLLSARRAGIEREGEGKGRAWIA